MCGRFTQYFDPGAFERLYQILLGVPTFDDELIEALAECHARSHNIAPTQHAAIIHADHDRRRLTPRSAHFGLIPSWANERSVSAKMVQARSETIWEKPAYRGLISSRRAVLPINGFYEWQPIPTQRSKQPWYVHRADENPMLLACIWDTWLDPDSTYGHDASPVNSFSIITTEANEQLADKHHRMPVILEPESLNAWFDHECDPRQVRELLRPSPEGILHMHRVSTRVNIPANNDPTLTEPDSNTTPATLWG